MTTEDMDASVLSHTEDLGDPRTDPAFERQQNARSASPLSREPAGVSSAAIWGSVHESARIVRHRNVKMIPRLTCAAVRTPSMLLILTE